MYPDTDSGLYLLENERQWSADRNSANPQFRRAYIACGRNPENTAPVLEQSARLVAGQAASLILFQENPLDSHSRSRKRRRPTLQRPRPLGVAACAPVPAASAAQAESPVAPAQARPGQNTDDRPDQSAHVPRHARRH